MFRKFACPALALLVLLAMGISFAPAQEAPPPISPLNQAYRTVVDDTIEIVVEGQDLGRTYIVPADGLVSFPPIGRVNLLNRTLEELAAEVAGQLKGKGHLTDPAVYVLVKAHAPRQAFLIGAVTRTIELPVHTKYGIVQILSIAGAQGFGGGAGTADFRNVTINRKALNGQLVRFTINVEDVLFRGDFRKNVEVKPNDVIFIPTLASESAATAVYILGKVNRPGKYTFQSGRDQMTLTKLLALAGDLHQFADESSIKILRKQGNRTVGFEIDFDEIIDLDVQDFVLQPDDLVFIPESPI